MSEITQDTIDRVAAALDSAEIGYSMSLVRVVDGVSTYCANIGGTVEEFTDTAEDQAFDQAYSRVRQVRLRKQAEAVIAALSEATA